MLFKESDLIQNPLSLLDSLSYLTEQEASLSAIMIPMIENTRLNTILVDEKYSNLIDEAHTTVVDESEAIINPSILSLYESVVIRPLSHQDQEFLFMEELCYSYFFDEAFDPSKHKDFGKDEWRSQYDISFHLGQRAIRMGPNGIAMNRQSEEDALDVLSKFFGVKLNPNLINKNLLKRVLDSQGWIGNAEDHIICDIVGLPSPVNNVKPKHIADHLSPIDKGIQKVKDKITTSKKSRSILSTISNNKGKIGVGLALTAGAYGLYKIISKKLEKQPKSVIGKRVAALRHIYKEWMERAQRSNDTGIAAKLRKAAATILQVIDMILEKIQNSAERVYASS